MPAPGRPTRIAPPSPSAWRRLATFAALALLIAVPAAIHACGSTRVRPNDAGASRRDPDPPPPPRPDPYEPANLPRAPEIRVLLGRLQGAQRFEIDRVPNAGGAGERVSVEAGPGGTIAVNGVQRSAPAEIAGTAFQIGDRAYGGRLVVAPDPEGGLRAVVAVPLEPYVVGVVAGEMPLSWPAAALEAQAIAARTYALHRRAGRVHETWDVFDDARSQVFVGEPAPSRWTPGLRAAVEATRGLVLVRAGRFGNAVYHAACGGTTVPTAEAFDAAGADRIPGVRCDDCAGAPRHRWDVEIDGANLARATGTRADALATLAVAAAQPSGRAREIRAGQTTPEGVRHRTVTAVHFRQSLGAKLPSTWIDAFERTRAGFRVRGRGFGHGAGLCQWGAAGKARRGLSAAAILADYYPDFQIVRIASE